MNISAVYYHNYQLNISWLNIERKKVQFSLYNSLFISIFYTCITE